MFSRHLIYKIFFYIIVYVQNRYWMYWINVLNYLHDSKNLYGTACERTDGHYSMC